MISASDSSRSVFFTAAFARSTCFRSANVEPSMITTEVCVTSPCVSLASSRGSVAPASIS